MDWNHNIKRAILFLALVLVLALPAAAQQGYVVCEPGVQPGQTVCQRQPQASGLRLAIVVVAIIHRHHKHKSPQQETGKAQDNLAAR
jgi:hypothetical protein